MAQARVITGAIKSRGLGGGLLGRGLQRGVTRGFFAKTPGSKLPKDESAEALKLKEAEESLKLGLSKKEDSLGKRLSRARFRGIFYGTNLPEKASCGVEAAMVLKPGTPDRDMLPSMLKILGGYKYRSGENLRTGESDGSGISVSGNFREFFQDKFEKGKFGAGAMSERLQDGNFVMGQYFLPQDPSQEALCREVIEAEAKKSGFRIAGWRSLNDEEGAINLSAISEASRKKMPRMWQAIMVPETEIGDIERASLELAAKITRKFSKLKIDHKNTAIVSQSSRDITYKGMILPDKMGEFFSDFDGLSSHVCASTLHARQATNTSPLWTNAQPVFPNLSHNGEKNTAKANAKEMRMHAAARKVHATALKALNKEFEDRVLFEADKSLSDSNQFARDLANLMIEGDSFEAAFFKLMSVPNAAKYSPEIQDLLSFLRLKRNPYNGPATIVSISDGELIARSDELGLRPVRCAVVENSSGEKVLYIGSDDVIGPLEITGRKVLSRETIEPGGAMMVTKEGEILRTKEVLQRVLEDVEKVLGKDVKSALSEHLFDVAEAEATKEVIKAKDLPDLDNALNRKLYSGFYDYEDVDTILQPMALQGYEPVGAMGNDTSLFPSEKIPLHISNYLHQLFAQVSAPAIDSVKELSRFSLQTKLGAHIDSEKGMQIATNSPILGEEVFAKVLSQDKVKVHNIDFTFPALDREMSSDDHARAMQEAIKAILVKAKEAALDGGIIVLSDKEIDPTRVAIPDLIITAAVRRFLEEEGLSRNVSIVVDSYQICGPHSSAALLSVGASAVYARGAYEKIRQLKATSPKFAAKSAREYLENYRVATEKSLLKTMGKVGVTNVANYSNGGFIAAFGIDTAASEFVTDPLEKYSSVSGIFAGVYSPLRGVGLPHFARTAIDRHFQAFSKEVDLSTLPHVGHFLPQGSGIDHGFSPKFVDSMQNLQKKEKVKRDKLRIHRALKEKGVVSFLTEKELESYAPEHGFLDRDMKVDGVYPDDYLERFSASKEYEEYAKTVAKDRSEHPASIIDHLDITAPLVEEPISDAEMESQKSLRKRLYMGHMSQGALTTASHDRPEKLGAHETLTRACKAVGVNSSAGEGGEDELDLLDPTKTSDSKQVSSGRFGVSVDQILSAKEIVIKVAQGAKPGEGGQLSAAKMTIRLANQRGSLMVDLISPPPHHDTYSIEDLQQLIYDIKSVNPEVQVSVKLVASQGIGQIAIGVANCGADIIEIAGNSGGTAAALVESAIKQSGFPSEFFVEADQALREAGLRDGVKLKVSGGIKTHLDIIKFAILGADLFEMGTLAMTTAGCVLQRTCNKSCEPGVATDPEKYKGEQITTESFFVNMAAKTQEWLKKRGFRSLDELKGRTDLLSVRDREMAEKFDFDAILARGDEFDFGAPVGEARSSQRLDDDYVEEILEKVRSGKDYVSEVIDLTTANRSFGARLNAAISRFERSREDRSMPMPKITLRCRGNAGQSFGFVNKYISLELEGVAQDGVGKSAGSGVIVIRPPESEVGHDNMVIGNSAFYGAYGGEAYIAGRAGNRCGVLSKGATIVVEGAGDFFGEYMTRGTLMSLDSVGDDIGTGASAGVILVYDELGAAKPSDSVRFCEGEEAAEYHDAIREMLENHLEKTKSPRAAEILSNPANFNNFKIAIPKSLSAIDTIKKITDNFTIYKLSKKPVSLGESVWLKNQTLEILSKVRDALPKKITNTFDLVDLKREVKATQMPSKIKDLILEDLEKTQKLVKNYRQKVSGISDLMKEVEEEKKAIKDYFKGLDRVNEDFKRFTAIRRVDPKTVAESVAEIKQYVAELARDAAGCSTCRAQSCSGAAATIGCPEEKPINAINAKLQELSDGLVEGAQLSVEDLIVLRQAWELQVLRTPFISYTAKACPAPCEGACTEGVTEATGAADSRRGGKKTGTPVQIRNVEDGLFKIGREMGWADVEPKEFSRKETELLFGDAEKRDRYLAAMKEFRSPFLSKKPMDSSKVLYVFGSGPAGMQMAYEGLREGLKVIMYEKSPHLGGLLNNGIPDDKFDKQYVNEDFERLKAMGLEVRTGELVDYDRNSKSYRVVSDEGRNIELIRAKQEDKTIAFAICTGSGKPRDLDKKVLEGLDESKRENIGQADIFLQAYNDCYKAFIANSTMSKSEREALIVEEFRYIKAHNLLAEYFKANPQMSQEERNDLARKRSKFIDNFEDIEDVKKMVEKIVVIGVGDTSKDVAHDAKEFFETQVEFLSRGPKSSEKRGVMDSYPSASLAEKGDLDLGKIHELSTPKTISFDGENYVITVERRKFLHQELIDKNPLTKALFDSLPRSEKKTVVVGTDELKASMIVLAMGYEADLSKFPDLSDNAEVCGDAKGDQVAIIVGAQKSASDAFRKLRGKVFEEEKPFMESVIPGFKKPAIPGFSVGKSAVSIDRVTRLDDLYPGRGEGVTA